MWKIAAPRLAATYPMEVSRKGSGLSLRYRFFIMQARRIARSAVRPAAPIIADMLANPTETGHWQQISQHGGAQY
jgi:hypothetical protein